MAHSGYTLFSMQSNARFCPSAVYCLSSRPCYVMVPYMRPVLPRQGEPGMPQYSVDLTWPTLRVDMLSLPVNLYVLTYSIDLYVSLFLGCFNHDQMAANIFASCFRSIPPNYSIAAHCRKQTTPAINQFIRGYTTWSKCRAKWTDAQSTANSPDRARYPKVQSKMCQKRKWQNTRCATGSATGRQIMDNY